MNMHKIRRKHVKAIIKTAGKQTKTSIVTYDATVGVIRIIDRTIDTPASPSVSPINLTAISRENIKKPVLAKIVQ